MTRNLTAWFALLLSHVSAVSGLQHHHSFATGFNLSWGLDADATIITFTMAWNNVDDDGGRHDWAAFGLHPAPGSGMADAEIFMCSPSSSNTNGTFCQVRNSNGGYVTPSVDKEQCVHVCCLLFVYCVYCPLLMVSWSHRLIASSPHRLMALFLFFIFVLPGTSISCPPPSSAIAPSLRFEGRRLRTKRRHALSTSPTPRWVLCTRAAPGRVPRCRRANRPSTRAQRATSSTFLLRLLLRRRRLFLPLPSTPASGPITLWRT